VGKGRWEGAERVCGRGRASEGSLSYGHPGLTADAFPFALGIERAQAEETQVQVVRRHRRVHRTHVLGIAGMGGPYLDGAPVRQERVSPGADLAFLSGTGRVPGHALSLPLGAAVTGCPAGTMREYWSGCTSAMVPPFSHLTT